MDALDLGLDALLRVVLGLLDDAPAPEQLPDDDGLRGCAHAALRGAGFVPWVGDRERCAGFGAGRAGRGRQVRQVAGDDAAHAFLTSVISRSPVQSATPSRTSASALSFSHSLTTSLPPL